MPISANIVVGIVHIINTEFDDSDRSVNFAAAEKNLLAISMAV